MESKELLKIEDEADAYAHFSDERGRLSAYIYKLLLETKRLREALKQIARNGEPHPKRFDAPELIARQALGGE